jgi:hypothetical protein
VPPQKNNQVSGIMNLSRNMGGDLGISFVTAFIARRSKSHQATLLHTTAYDPQFQAGLARMAAGMQRAGASAVDATHRATLGMYRQLVVHTDLVHSPDSSPPAEGQKKARQPLLQAASPLRSARARPWAHDASGSITGP